jgi:hypothetical protein
LQLAFSPQCGDAVGYLELGQACAAGWDRCWEPLRPVGAILYYSLPYRLGLRPESIIVVNWLLALGSVALMYETTRRLAPGSSGLRWSRLLAILVGHLLFLGSPSWNSLSDLPATVFALAGVQCMLLAHELDRWWCHLATGLLLGISVSLRAFYLYPAVLTVAALLLASVRQPRRLLRRCAVLVVLLPIACQYGETYRRSHMIGFLYPPVEKLGRRIHFQSTLAGYDTSLTGAVPYDAKDCFRQSRNFKDAVEKRDGAALACVLGRRYAFYLGTYTAGGKVYITSPAERHKSTLLLIVNSLVLAAASARLGLRGRRPESILVGAFLLMVFAQSLFIVPEARFLYAVLVWMWCDVLDAIILAVGPGQLAQRWRAWRSRPAAAAPV